MVPSSSVSTASIASATAGEASAPYPFRCLRLAHGLHWFQFVSQLQTPHFHGTLLRQSSHPCCHRPHQSPRCPPPHSRHRPQMVLLLSAYLPRCLPVPHQASLRQRYPLPPPETLLQ